MRKEKENEGEGEARGQRYALEEIDELDQLDVRAGQVLAPVLPRLVLV
jgi:hypothetical protein